MSDVITSGLTISGLVKSFGGVHALRGIDFEVKPGEVHALVGENGSGKSTFVKVLAGFHRPNAVTDARIAGREIDLGSAAAAHQAGIRFVHQELGLVDSMSVVDNFGIGRGYETGKVAIRWRSERRRASAAISRLGYSFDVTQPVGDLPIAERTVVAIARAVDVPEGSIHLLVLDEPTASLTAGEAERLFDVIRSVRAEGISVIFVSHHLEEVLDLADRITVLRDGNVIGTFNAAEIDRPRLIELITGGALAEHTPSAGAQAEQPELMRVHDLSSKTISGLNLTLHKGEIVGVAGLTGSGRDELALVLFGIVPHATGSFVIDGEDFDRLTPEIATTRGLGFVSGDRHRYALIPSFSLRENVTVSDLDSCVSRGVLRRRLERQETYRWIELFNLRPANPEVNIMALSGGNQQKAALAKVMRVQPKLLLLDDPTRGVDVGAKAEIHRLVEAAAADGAGVLLCSSDNEELARVCTKVIVLRRGAVVQELDGGNFDAAVLGRIAL